MFYRVLLRRVCTALGLALFATSLWAAKPQGPFSITLQLDDSGEMYLVTATLESRFDIDNISLTILDPPKLVLVEGITNWSGSIASGEEIETTLIYEKPAESKANLVWTAIAKASSEKIHMTRTARVSSKDKFRSGVLRQFYEQATPRAGAREFRHP